MGGLLGEFGSIDWGERTGGILGGFGPMVPVGPWHRRERAEG